MAPVNPNQQEPEYAPYYRAAEAQHGSADRLESLAKGYYSIGWIFFLNILVAFGLFQFSLEPPSNILGSVLLLALVATFAALPYRQLKLIGYGLGWRRRDVNLVALFMGLNSLVCGLFGYAILQQKVLVEMGKYGIPIGYHGPTKRAVYKKIKELRSTGETKTTGESS